MKKLVLGIVFLCLANLSHAVSEKKLEAHFGDGQGCFLLQELKSSKMFEVSNSDCEQRYAPVSTFKIPMALIGLESGAIGDPNEEVLWDGKKRQSPYWNRNHDLYSAMQFSVLPYFARLAFLVGYPNIRPYLKKFEYGNQFFLTRMRPTLRQKYLFWLNDELKISPQEQLSFLKKLYNNQLPIQAMNGDIVKKALIQRAGVVSTSVGAIDFDLQWGPDVVFSAKTGGKRGLSWLVGHIQTSHKAYVFVSVLSNSSTASALRAAEGILNSLERAEVDRVLISE